MIMLFTFCFHKKKKQQLANLFWNAQQISGGDCDGLGLLWQNGDL